jgi:rhodanese-related sulfurtransferase
MKRVLMISTIILPILTLLGCGNTITKQTAEPQRVQVNGGSYRNITPAQLSSMLEHKNFLLVNVHIPYEGEIPQTDLFVPYNEIEKNLSKLPKDMDVEIVLYCRSGSMSAIAARELVKLGFNNLSNLAGGMVEWEKQGYELIRKP